MTIGSTAAYQVAREARQLVQQAQKDQARLISTDEEKSRLGDEYLGQPGRVKSRLSGGKLGTLKFDPGTGEVRSFRSEYRNGLHSPFFTVLKATRSCEGMRYNYSDLGGWTSTTISINDQTGNWTVQKNALGLPLGERYVFGDLSQPESSGQWLMPQ